MDKSMGNGVCNGVVGDGRVGNGRVGDGMGNLSRVSNCM
jgi:hypothetical protein